MDKSCHSSADSSASSINNTSISASTTTSADATTSTNNRDQFLRHLNKLSHKISKPPSSSTTGSVFRRPPVEPPVHLRPPPPAPPLQQQPPVYNINKSDFRDVVQKLTGSPAHERIQSPAQPPMIHAPKPASSRLQRIRPPPLAQLSNRPPSMLNCAVSAGNPMNPPAPTNPLAGGGFFLQVAPLSPLPPFPSCHGAAESPISAYMRFLHTSLSSFTSHNPHQMQPPHQQHPMNPPSSSASDSMPPPSSPLPFGCLPSPKSPCPLLSPNLRFSPTGNGPLGFPQLPISPTVPGVPSPK